MTLIRAIHPVAGAVALGMITLFWLSTALSELFAGPATVAMVKTLIPWGFLILIPALIGVGASGAHLSRTRRGALVAGKQKRMPFIAANGVLILIPSALFLASRAGAGVFDGAFYGVQAIELIAGALNIALLSLNMRDGLRMRAQRRHRPA